MHHKMLMLTKQDVPAIKIEDLKIKWSTA